MAKEWYVELSNPPYPNKGRKVRVFRKWVSDQLSPTLTHLYRVKEAEDKEDALAQVMAGKAFTMVSPTGKALGYVS
ncbi:hypothetical protein [Nitrospira sp. BLG_2]|uniref:hypothetical protein n=1 Tax=Nitrospira sp. BLG_2 TaxID=3397507 RepID=UPI003B9C65D1